MSQLTMDRARFLRDGSRVAAFLASAGCIAGVAACSAPRTWPSAGDNSVLSADAPPLPQVVVSALNYAHDEIAKGSPLVYNLPAEINPAAFPAFERRLAPGKPMCPGDTGVWTVRQARINGSTAEVDIEYPSRDGFYQTVTVHLQGATGGIDYRPSYLQYWKLPVKDPVCQQPLAVVERLCGADAAAKLRVQREAAAPAPGSPPKAAPASASEEPSK